MGQDQSNEGLYSLNFLTDIASILLDKSAKYHTVWSSDLYTLLMRYELDLTSYRIKSVYKSLDQTV